MGFKVVNVFPLAGADFGDELLDPLGATLVKGMWMKEEEIIAQAHDADAIIGVVSIQPFNRRLLTRPFPMSGHCRHRHRLRQGLIWRQRPNLG